MELGVGVRVGVEEGVKDGVGDGKRDGNEIEWMWEMEQKMEWEETMGWCYLREWEYNIVFESPQTDLNIIIQQIHEHTVVNMQCSNTICNGSLLSKMGEC